MAPTPLSANLKQAFKHCVWMFEHATLTPNELNLLLIMLQEYFKDKRNAN